MESAQRLKKTHEDNARQLGQDIRIAFGELQRHVHDFAEEHWDDSESSLNDAWVNEVKRFGMDKKILAAQEQAILCFSTEINDLLEEVGRELTLERRFASSTAKLYEQDSSVWLGKTLKWGSGLAGLGMTVFALANWWNPAGWVWAVVGFVGFISSLFESKASKQRKAVSKISVTLESQLEKQKAQILQTALKNFREQCTAGEVAVLDYFNQSADGLTIVGQALARGSATLEAQVSILNTHFAARILDFANGSPSEPSVHALRAQIRNVRRKIGEHIDIDVSPKVQSLNNLNIIESVIQETITLQKVGV